MRAVVVQGAGGNFCSGGDVHEIIGPLIRLKAPELLMFTRMTGDLVKAMRACPQPIVAAIDGVCAGAGAIMAMASDLRIGTARSKTAFLFNRVGLAGCDMGACAMLPRIVVERPGRVIGKSTTEAMQSGIFWGYVGLVEGMVKRIAEEFGGPLDVVATGGLAPLFHGTTPVITHLDPDITMRGLVEIYRRNRS